MASLTSPFLGSGATSLYKGRSFVITMLRWMRRMGDAVAMARDMEARL
jgi:hypothetical protein